MGALVETFAREIHSWRLQMGTRLISGAAFTEYTLSEPFYPEPRKLSSKENRRGAL